MADEIKPDIRQSMKIQIDELKAAQLEILKAIKEIENYFGEVFMAEGDYHGVKFEG